ncbi:cupredoxin domain-containing protein [Chitinimonas viridis]|uniref:Cupredoxin domain-containing protein n=1 Tax=Chitinimonas viridis TaxID=664880 RepID=A0ABT8B427_9NEIS|nr:cupredoxin domain-containing protein [Chitinimonas viridis]MDN3576406.1 cupredoxin domain-containing protein [Chitinimonas viridis]
MTGKAATHLATALVLLLTASTSIAGELITHTITAEHGRLSPAVLTVPAGQRIKLVLRNGGQSPIEFENLRLRVEKVLAPGASSFVVLNPLRPGEYQFIDEFHPDTGRLVLTAH